jgi:hypothetical protein
MHYANFAKETISAGGTDNLTLSGALTAAHITINAAVGTNNRFKYVAKDGNDYEVGIGYLSASTTLVREAVHETVVSGSVTRGTNLSKLNLSTSTEIGIDVSAQAVMGAHSGYAFAAAGVNGLMSFGSVHGAGTAAGGFNGFLNMIPYYFAASKVVTKCMVHVVGTAASAQLRIGLWPKAPGGKPGVMMVEFTNSATIDCSASGAKTATPTAGVWVPAGDYFIGALGNNSSITIKCPQYSPTSLDMGMTAGGVENLSIFRALTFGALPTGDQSGESWIANNVGHSFWLD